MFELARFSIRLVCGISLMWCLMPRRDVSSGFFRIQMLVVLGLSVLAALAFAQADPSDAARALDAASSMIPTATARNLSIALALAAFWGSVLWTLERRSGGTWVVFGIAATSAATLLLATPLRGAGAGSAVLAFVSELSAAALLGAALTGMLLGHWYLTAPTMSLDPLVRMTSVFGYATAARAVVAVVCVWLAMDSFETATHAMWLALRWAAGIIAPVILWLMVRRILRYRNTQSATGVLFVAVILTFIGEMTALLLEHETGRPL